MMLWAVRNGCFGQMKNDLMNDYEGYSTYLETPYALVSLMNIYKTSTQNKLFLVLNKPTGSLVLVQRADYKEKKPKVTKTEKGKPQAKKKEGPCFHCGGGHQIHNDPEVAEAEQLPAHYLRKEGKEEEKPEHPKAQWDSNGIDLSKTS